MHVIVNTMFNETKINGAQQFFTGVIFAFSKKYFSTMNTSINTFAAYISGFPEDIQMILEQIRATIRQSAPDATEGISYGMPTFKLGGKPLVYFAAFKNHIGFYATPTGHAAFAEALSPYKQGKGSVQFPLNQPIPLDLIAKMTEYKIAEKVK